MADKKKSDMKAMETTIYKNAGKNVGKKSTPRPAPKPMPSSGRGDDKIGYYAKGTGKCKSCGKSKSSCKC